MKYEDYSLVNFNIILFVVFIIIIISFSIINKINIYSGYKIIYTNNNIYEIIVSNKELKDFYDNSTLYIDNKKYKYNIDRVNKNILKKDKVNYNEIFIVINKKNNYKSNDIIDVNILKDKKRLLEMFNIFDIM